MVIAVAFILAFAAIGLKPAQERNIAIDKMSQILNSVNIASTPENAQELYGKYIDDSFIINSKGELAKGESFSINIADQLKLPEIDKPCPYSSTPTITSLPNTLSLFPVAGYGDPFGDTYR